MVKKIIHFLESLVIGFVAGFFIGFSLLKNINKKNSESELEKDEENVFENKAELAKKQTIEKLSNTSACDITEQYDDVCDTITEGKQRFSNRAKRILQSRRSKSNDHAIK